MTSSVTSLTGNGILESEFVSRGIRVRSLDLPSSSMAVLGIPRLARALSKERPDIVQTWLHAADFTGTAAAKLAGCQRLVWNIRCSDVFAHDTRWTSKVLSKLLVKLSTVPQAVVANAESAKRFHQSLGYCPQSWHLIPNGIDTDVFKPVPNVRISGRAALGIGADCTVICHAGRNHPMKDRPLFLSAAKSILRRRPNVYVIVAGECGPADAADDRILWIGHQREMQSVYAMADIFCLSSLYGEGFPNVLAEAMACGVPCVTTDVGDAARIVGEAGVVVPPGDQGAMINALEEMLKTPADAFKALGDSARGRILAHYSIKPVAKRYAALYESLLTN